MALAVKEPRRLLLKLVGTEALLSQDKLISYFKAFLQTRIKTHLAQVITEQKLSIFELDAHLEELSDSLKTKLLPDFAAYGLSLTQMLVTAIVKPEGDPVYEKFKDLHFKQYADVREAPIKQQVSIIEQETAAQRTVISAKHAQKNGKSRAIPINRNAASMLQKRWPKTKRLVNTQTWELAWA